MRLLYTLALASFINQASYAAELNLVCITEDINSAFETRQVIVGDEAEYKTLQTNSEGSTIVRLKQYAVVIELIGGENGNAAEEKWEVLNSDQFSIEILSGIPEESQSWKFSILDTNETYLCSENGVVHANPALTRSN